MADNAGGLRRYAANPPYKSDQAQDLGHSTRLQMPADQGAQGRRLNWLTEVVETGGMHGGDQLRAAIRPMDNVMHTPMTALTPGLPAG